MFQLTKNSNKNWIFTTLSKWYSKSVWTSMLYECLMYQRALWHLNTLKYSQLCFSSFSIRMLKMWLMRHRVRPRRKERNAFLLALAILWLNATCRPTYRLGAVTPNYASCSILAVWLQSVKRSCLQCVCLFYDEASLWQPSSWFYSLFLTLTEPLLTGSDIFVAKHSSKMWQFSALQKPPTYQVLNHVCHREYIT